MSKFEALLKGLEHLSPQTKQILKESGEKLKVLQNTPDANPHEIQRLSDMIKNTVEANAKRGELPTAAPTIDPVIQRDMQRLNKYDEMTKTRAGDLLNEGPQPQANVKKAAGFAAVPAGGMQNPLDMIKEGYNKFEDLRGNASDFLADKVTSFLPEVSKAQSIDQAKAVMNTATDPLSYVGGVGAVDAAIGATSALPEDSFSKLRKALGK